MASKPRRPAPAPAGKGGASAREKTAAWRQAQQAAERRRQLIRRVVLPLGAAAVIAAISVGVVLANNHGPQSGPPTSSGSDAAGTTLTGPPGPEGIVLEQAPVLAPASSAADGQTVDGVQCNTSEQVAYHIHSHLAVFVNGSLRALPPGIGIVDPVEQNSPQGAFYGASRCYYWLHVHAQDGIIHVESPTPTTYTLGQFFALWRQPLTATQVGPATGTVTAYVNGTRYAGDPAAIPLQGHEDIQLDVGTVVPPKKVDWSTAEL